MEQARTNSFHALADTPAITRPAFPDGQVPFSSRIAVLVGDNLQFSIGRLTEASIRFERTYPPIPDEIQEHPGDSRDAAQVKARARESHRSVDRWSPRTTGLHMIRVSIENIPWDRTIMVIAFPPSVLTRVRGNGETEKRQKLQSAFAHHYDVRPEYVLRAFEPVDGRLFNDGLNAMLFGLDKGAPMPCGDL